MKFKIANAADAATIAGLVIKLTEEISRLTQAKFFKVDVEATTQKCAELIESQNYNAIIVLSDDLLPIALATFTESYALYAGGKIGIIPEFYVVPEYRSRGVGEQLIAKVKALGRERGWACIELCTPPLPEFERTLQFYQKTGMKPVGGRKMREYLA